MTISWQSVALAEAKPMLAAAEAQASRIGLPYSIAIVDAGGHLLAFARQDGASIGTADLATNKARTALYFHMGTHELAPMAQPDGPLFGIHTSHEGRTVIFGGGLPLRAGDAIIGAVGASAGSIAQDLDVVQAALDAFAALDGSGAV